MSLNEDFAICDPAADVQKGYDESARAVFDAASLRPWTISRHSVAIALRCKIVAAIGPIVAEFLADSTYDNIFRDVIIVLYLSSLTDDRVIELDSSLDAKVVMADAYEWAELHEITYGSKLFMTGVSLLDGILKNILASYFEVEPGEGSSFESKKKDTVVHGKSRSQDQPASQAESLQKKSFARCLWRKLFNGSRSIIATSETLR